jgi:hypothetical protein
LAWRASPDVELGLIGRAALAAGLSWWVADLATSVTTPLLAVFTALVVLQATTRATLRMAITRTLAVVVGAILGVALGEAIPLTALTVALIVAVALFVADFAMRLPLAAARQVPMVMVLVLAAATADDDTGSIWSRALQTALGAAIGAGVSVLLPTSRVSELTRALTARARRLGAVWELIAAGLAAPWTIDDATAWRRQAGTTLGDPGPTAGSSDIELARQASRWSYRRRRDGVALDALTAYAGWLDEATVAVGRLVDDLERAAPDRSLASWPRVAEMSAAVATAIAATADEARAPSIDDPADRALRQATSEVNRAPSGQPTPRVDQQTVAADIDRLVCRLRPMPAAVTRAASPSPR